MASTRTERRQHDRTAVELAATIERISGRPLTGSATTVDLSLGGARLVAPAGFGVGDVVKVALASGDVSIEHQALVVGRQEATRSTATLNLAFKSLDDRSAEVLRRVLDLT
ncbi:MAG TPA: PilZ domain-containing protein [Acidimicrobiales bacterium]|jgi:c-di-GMP-binding flagellar brake protein YcgR|nr:PilZ domain-containing protein [Acidimicrobiales bacterium]